MNTNDKIGDVLKYYRRLNKLSVVEVADMLVEYNIHVKPKTIYGWESNQNPPSADKFLVLCYIYKIPDINSSFLQKKSGKSIKLTKDESLLLRQYREMTDMQPAVRRILEMPEPDTGSVSKSQSKTQTNHQDQSRTQVRSHMQVQPQSQALTQSQMPARAKLQKNDKFAKPQFMAERNTLLPPKTAENGPSYHK